LARQVENVYSMFRGVKIKIKRNSKFCNLFEDKDRKRYMLYTPINILYLPVTKKCKMVISKDDRDSNLVFIKTWRNGCISR
jgi:hypothetical protein